MYVALEFNKETKLIDLRHVTVFGPFDTHEDANEFVNARIATLAGEWDKREGLVTETLHWKVSKVNSIQ